MPRPNLSIVISLLNEEAVLRPLVERLKGVLDKLETAQHLSWEVVFIDDGSQDESLKILKGLATSEPRLKVLSFSRNFGHQAAITAGLDRAEGDFVVLMDADLQDPPEVILDMLAEAKQGYDVVYGQRTRRHGETLFKRWSAALFYRSMRLITGVDIPVDAGDFRLMTRQVVLTLRALREHHRFMRGLVAWVGFKQTAVRYDRPARIAGETKYPLRRMLRFAADGATSFSVVPLRVATWLGLLTGIIATGGGLTAVGIKLFAPHIVIPGWTALVVVMAFGFSAQLLITGLLGEYVGRIYEELKRRPLYITAQELNFEESQPHGNAVDSDRPPPKD